MLLRLLSGAAATAIWCCYQILTRRVKVQYSRAMTRTISIPDWLHARILARNRNCVFTDACGRTRRVSVSRALIATIDRGLSRIAVGDLPVDWSRVSSVTARIGAAVTYGLGGWVRVSVPVEAYLRARTISREGRGTSTVDVLRLAILIEHPKTAVPPPESTDWPTILRAAGLPGVDLATEIPIWLDAHANRGAR